MNHRQEGTGARTKDFGIRTHKTKILTTLLLVAAAFFAVFNTSTRYGRWLYWQESDYGDMDRFAYRMVAAADKERRVLRTQLNSRSSGLRDLIATLPVAGDSTIADYFSQHDSTALIIVHGDSLLLEQYFQGHDRASLQMSFSCTKSIVSLLVGIAVEEGLIDSPDDPISRYVEDLAPDFDQVSIRHLMTMTSGISDADETLLGVPAPWGDEVKGYYDPDFRALATTFRTTYPPGERFEYHDFNPIVIGLLLEQVTNKSVAHYMEEKLWQPLGAEFPARWSLDHDDGGFAKPESGLNARAIDFARLGSLLIDPRQTIVAKEWLRATIHDRRASELMTKRFDRYADALQQQESPDHELIEHVRSLRYGLYWWGVERDGRYDYYANGHLGQFLYVSPAANLVIVRHGKTHGGSDDHRFGDIFFRLASAVIDAKGQQPPRQP